VADLTTIPMQQFSLRWLLTDPKYRVLPPAHLEQIKPVDAASARLLFDMTGPWRREQPFTRDYFADVASTPLGGQDMHEGKDQIRRVRKWLYRRGVPFRHRVFMSWSETEAAVTTWRILVKYWDDLWYPGSDDLAVFDESLSWALFLWHQSQAFFASRPVPSDSLHLGDRRRPAKQVGDRP
jgi:hypothetical protein